MKLILTTNAQSNRDIGLDHDPDSLTAVGLIEARQLGLALKSSKIYFAYCSSTTRAKDTMEAILSEISDNNIGVSLSSFLRPKTTVEELAKLKSRINIFLDDLKYDHTDEEIVLIVTHRKVASMIAFLLVGEVVEIEQASISIFEVKGEEKTCEKLNSTDHLK